MAASSRRASSGAADAFAPRDGAETSGSIPSGGPPFCTSEHSVVLDGPESARKLQRIPISTGTGYPAATACCSCCCCDVAGVAKPCQGQSVLTRIPQRHTSVINSKESVTSRKTSVILYVSYIRCDWRRRNSNNQKSQAEPAQTKAVLLLRDNAGCATAATAQYGRSLYLYLTQCPWWRQYEVVDSSTYNETNKCITAHIIPYTYVVYHRNASQPIPIR